MAGDGHSPMDQFIIKPLVPMDIGGVDISFTNSSLWMVLGLIVSTMFFMIASRKRAMVPDRLQASAEYMYEFLAKIVKDNIGSDGKQYFPFVFSIFLMVFMCNALGLIPMSFTPTSHIVTTFSIAMVVFLFVTIMGFVKNGTEFFSVFAPSGVPGPILLLVVPLEMISFCIRPITLAIRLAVNMVAGHLILKVFAGFGPMLVTLGVAGIALGSVPVMVNVAVYALELLVAFIQAYIFAILTSVYLKDTVDLHH